MRMLKSRGGLAHGRGVTPSTQAKLVHVIPQAVPICDSLELFSGVYSSTTDQHRDIRPSSKARDGLDYLKFKEYLTQHSPFAYKDEHKDKLVCISSGIVAPSKANADKAFEVGEEAARQMTGNNYAEVKLKRNDRVISIGTAINSTQVRGFEVEIDPMSLFLRVLCVIQKQEEMKEHLAYEFSKHPPSLFEGLLMRKTIKCTLADELKSGVTQQLVEPQNPLYVVDGGHLLHSVVWPVGCRYANIINEYVAFVLLTCSNSAVVCFDGYDDISSSTKAHEQSRRVLRKNVAPDILYTGDMPVTCSKDAFLSNNKNKARLISSLIDALNDEGIACITCRCALRIWNQRFSEVGGKDIIYGLLLFFV